MNAGFPASLGFGVGGRSYSNFMASTVKGLEGDGVGLCGSYIGLV